MASFRLGPSLALGTFPPVGTRPLSRHILRSQASAACLPTPTSCALAVCTVLRVLVPELSSAWQLTPRSVGFKLAAAAAAAVKAHSGRGWTPQSVRGGPGFPQRARKRKKPVLAHMLFTPTSCAWAACYKRSSPGLSFSVDSIGGSSGFHCFQRNPSSPLTPPAQRSPQGPRRPVAGRRSGGVIAAVRGGGGKVAARGARRRCRSLANRRPLPVAPRRRALRCPRRGRGGSHAAHVRRRRGRRAR